MGNLSLENTFNAALDYLQDIIDNPDRPIKIELSFEERYLKQLQEEMQRENQSHE